MQAGFAASKQRLDPLYRIEMETTTLFTFRMRHATALSVELLGSWDNFVKPYSMQRDSRKDHAEWTGCYTFQDIICDGDPTGPLEKRNGGLKMGGTYWYYYRINGVEEWYDDAEPTTTNCPLLPGQVMNVLEVPRDTGLQSSNGRSTSFAYVFASQTLDPDDRFLNPRPVPQPARPSLRKIITPATFAPQKSNNGSFRAEKGRPWSARSTAGGVKNAIFPTFHRDIKSASESPTESLKSLFDRTKLHIPISALTPSQGGRGRSRTLHAPHKQVDRTDGPIVRRRRASEPFSPTSENLSPVETLREADSNTFDMASKRKTIGSSRRAASPHRLVREVVELSSPADTLDIYPNESLVKARGRSLSPVGRRLNLGITRRGHDNNDSAPRRSLSLNRLRREPSPLRNVISHFYVTKEVDTRIPEGIIEAENEDLLSPRKPCTETAEEKTESPARYSPQEINIQNGEPTNMQGRAARPLTASRLQEDLPPLPDYLYPKPLFANSAKASEAVGPIVSADEESLAEPRHFFDWSDAASDLRPEHPESPTTEMFGNSPTFSSIKDTESGVSSPHRLSGSDQGMELSRSDSAERLAEFVFTSGDVSTIDDTLMDAQDSLDHRTPTAKSFAPHTVMPISPLPEHFSAADTEHQAKVQPARQPSEMEQLLSDFDYLGLAVL